MTGLDDTSSDDEEEQEIQDVFVLSELNTTPKENKIMTLTVHPVYPTELKDIIDNTVCRHRDGFVSPVDVLEHYKPCNRVMSRKIWTEYKITHPNIDIKSEQLVRVDGKRKSNTECVSFKVIIDILNTNRDIFPSFRTENDILEKKKTIHENVTNKKEEQKQLIAQKIDPRVMEYMLQSFKHEEEMKKKEIEMKHLEIQLQAKQHEYQSFLLDKQHSLKLAEQVITNQNKHMSSDFETFVKSSLRTLLKKFKS
jgi:hypothetical protein